MSSSQDDERDAFLALLATFDLKQHVISLSDLGDAGALFDFLREIDPNYFRHPVRSISPQGDNWVLRFSSLKRLYRLMAQYLADILHQSTTELDVPDLQAMARDYETNATLTMCRLALVIAVQSEKNKSIIERIQDLNEKNQHCLMKAIEQIIAKLRPSNVLFTKTVTNSGMTDDDHFYAIQSDRGRIFLEKEALQSAYQNLLEEHRVSQTTRDDAIAEKEDATTKLRDLRREVDDRRNDRTDGLLRAEIDRLRVDLQKSEDNLSTVEHELDKRDKLVSDMEHRIEELQLRSEDATRLKDQLDEFRHAADKLQKTENVMEKYKKKLEESADLRKRLKASEEENSTLVDKNAALEEEFKKVSSLKPLLESYKHQVTEMETRQASRLKEVDSLRFELEQCRTLLRIAEEERAKDNETLDLFQERIRELELISVRPENPVISPSGSTRIENHTELSEAGLTVCSQDEDDVDRGLRAEIDDAESGRTMTDLKIEIRKLKREMKAAKLEQQDGNQLLILQNLLDDANRHKCRYEQEYLTIHRENLVLQKNLDDIRSGKTLGDGTEAAIALRHRLNETVDQLDILRKDHATLEVEFRAMSDELIFAKSNLNLVNKDQVEILANLRRMVESDKAGLISDVEKLRQQVKDLTDKNKMQLEQINGLLMEKVSLQSESIGQRERMLERERNFRDLKLSVNSKDFPEDVKHRILRLHDENLLLQDQLHLSQEKLAKAKGFIKNQDKQFKAEQARSNASSPRAFGEMDFALSSQMKLKDEEVERLKKQMQDMQKLYETEGRLLQNVIISLGTEQTQESLSVSPRLASSSRSWLGQQRRSLSRALRQ